jgi:hypothetical protein
MKSNYKSKLQYQELGKSIQNKLAKLVYAYVCSLCIQLATYHKNGSQKSQQKPNHLNLIMYV